MMRTGEMPMPFIGRERARAAGSVFFRSEIRALFISFVHVSSSRFTSKAVIPFTRI